MKKTTTNQENYKKSLKWITKLLKKNNIKFIILGGLAAYAYGSKRELEDIDICIKNKDLPKLAEITEKYIIEKPHISITKDWKCYYMEIEKNKITIEISGNKEAKFLNPTTKKWEELKIDLSKPQIRRVFNIELPIIPKQDLIEYKRKLKRGVDLLDIKNIENREFS